MDSSLFNPHKFHPTRYAEDPYDLLLPLSGPEGRERPHHMRTCTKCGKKVERNCPQTKVNFICKDCDREIRLARENERNRKKRI